MNASSYLFAAFIFVLVGLFLLLLRQVLRGINGVGGKQYERENRIYTLYQTVEDEIESLEEYVQEVREELTKEKADLAAMLIQTKYASTSAGRQAREAELDQVLNARASMDNPQRRRVREEEKSATEIARKNAQLLSGHHDKRTALPELEQTPALERILRTGTQPMAQRTPASKAPMSSEAPEISRPVFPRVERIAGEALPEALPEAEPILAKFDTPPAPAERSAIPALITRPGRQTQPSSSSQAVERLTNIRKEPAARSAYAETQDIFEFSPEASAQEHETAAAQDRNSRIWEMKRRDMSEAQIAREMGISMAEVILILGIGRN